jgi:eukaryotic-like serine/threonine-protein kinase
MLVGQKKLPLDQALRYIEECTQGLAYSWQRGLTHRDIKPTNILVSTADAQAKLVDFGLAEISTGSTVYLQRQDDKDEDVAVDRTVDYAGLEKATNQKPGDVRSDIYFLGAVLYECITGEPIMPVTKDRHVRMMARRYQDVEDTLAKNGAALGVPSQVMPLLTKMLAYEPTKRFQTPTDLLEAIQACRQELIRHTAPKQERAGPKTLFAVETREHLKQNFRDKFKARGFRVLVSSDPAQALKQYKQQPYHALIVDAGSVGREAIEAFNRVVKEANTAKRDLVAVLLLEKKQADWAAEATVHPRAAVLVFPFSMRELIEKIRSLGAPPEQNGPPKKSG